MKNYHVLDLIAAILLVVGGLVWGLVGLFDFNLLETVFGLVIARILFVIVGIAAVYRIIVWFRNKKAK